MEELDVEPVRREACDLRDPVALLEAQQELGLELVNRLELLEAEEQ